MHWNLELQEVLLTSFFFMKISGKKNHGLGGDKLACQHWTQSYLYL